MVQLYGAHHIVGIDGRYILPRVDVLTGLSEAGSGALFEPHTGSSQIELEICWTYKQRYIHVASKMIRYPAIVSSPLFRFRGKT
jgi:hypothetical protein